MSKKPTVLMILDGYGLNDRHDGNAVYEAKTPVMDGLMKDYPFVKGNASGLAVGLPDGQMGNSEVGHMNMGAGRIVYQELTRITKEIQDGDFFKNEALLTAMKNASVIGSDVEATAIPRSILWDFFLTVAYTATIHISTDFLRWQRERDSRKFTYTASWMDVTHRLHPVKSL